MNVLDVKKELEEVLTDLERIDGVDGSLIADNSSRIICHRMHRYTDVDLFGSMSNVIVNSSERLLNSSEQGKIERVLIESANGKALFLDLDKVNFIILMELSANVGWVMVSAKRAAEKILKISKDLVISTEADYKKEPIPTETTTPSETTEKIASEKIINRQPISKSEPESSPALAKTPIRASETLISEKKGLSIEDEVPSVESGEDAKKEIVEKLTEDFTLSTEPVKSTVEEIKEVSEKLEEEKLPEKETLPSIKPPISFPQLPDHVKVPEDAEKRSELILDIYEAIFLAMSMGASKIMGVAPARGLTKKFLPLKSCKKLLFGVDVKTNSVINFDTIRDNAHKITLEAREEILVNDFSKIIDIITENYGKVMGYEAFRGMVRPEFNVIKKSYGNAMDELDIKKKIHPELINLLN
ncbi:MAG: hypothetical protein CIT01_08170 [Methanobacterium sp. BRmetb2]|nr:MAG: hypothetical protein CIT01_08170 [Methanobacterium sp. BRmetb2]